MHLNLALGCGKGVNDVISDTTRKADSKYYDVVSHMVEATQAMGCLCQDMIFFNFYFDQFHTHLIDDYPPSHRHFSYDPYDFTIKEQEWIYYQAC